MSSRLPARLGSERSTPSRVNPARTSTRSDSGLRRRRRGPRPARSRLRTSIRRGSGRSAWRFLAAGLGEQPVADLDLAELAVDLVEVAAAEDLSRLGIGDEEREKRALLHPFRQSLRHDRSQGVLVECRHVGPAADVRVLESGRDRRGILGRREPEEGRRDGRLRPESRAAATGRQTCARSLSPRPERQRTISSASRSSTRASACAGSSAGRIPSVSASRRNAASASWSVACR